MDDAITRSVWVVVLTWNGRADTLELLTTLSACDATVVVVDNGSTDGTLEAIAERYPTVRTVQTGTNLGYAGGNNVGVDLALASGADVVAVLNNDTLVEPAFLGPLVDAVRGSRLLAVSPDIRYAAEPDVSWFRGAVVDPGIGWPQHLAPAAQPPVDRGPIASPVLTGCCLVASADVWRRVGGFDDGLFLMFEDSDWSMRARRAGVDLEVVPASRILHKVSRSFTGSASLLGNYYFARNGAIFAARHLGPLSVVNFVVRQVLRSVPRRGLSRGQRRAALLSVLGLFAAGFGRRGPAGAFARHIAHANRHTRTRSAA